MHLLTVGLISEKHGGLLRCGTLHSYQIRPSLYHTKPVLYLLWNLETIARQRQYESTFLILSLPKLYVGANESNKGSKIARLNASLKYWGKNAHVREE